MLSSTFNCVICAVRISNYCVSIGDAIIVRSCSGNIVIANTPPGAIVPQFAGKTEVPDGRDGDILKLTLTAEYIPPVFVMLITLELPDAARSRLEVLTERALLHKYS